MPNLAWRNQAESFAGKFSAREDQVGSNGPDSIGKSIFTSGVLAGSPIVTEPTVCGAGIVGNAGRSGRSKLKSGAAVAKHRARTAEGHLYRFMEIGHLPGKSIRP